MQYSLTEQNRNIKHHLFHLLTENLAIAGYRPFAYALLVLLFAFMLFTILCQIRFNGEKLWLHPSKWVPGAQIPGWINSCWRCQTFLVRYIQ